MAGKGKVTNTINKKLPKATDLILQAAKRGATKTSFAIIKQGVIETPLETSNLVQHWTKVPQVDYVSKLKGIRLTFGNNADYAAYVHEMINANFTGPRKYAKTPSRRKGGKPTAKAKFLEDPLKAHAGQLMRDIQTAIRGLVGK